MSLIENCDALLISRLKVIYPSSQILDILGYVESDYIVDELALHDL